MVLKKNYAILLNDILTYLHNLGLPFRDEHRPATTILQWTQFWAALAALLEVLSSVCSSASASRLLEFLWRPLFLLPFWFQVRAWCVMLDDGFLKVCTIQPHFRRVICISIASHHAFLHRSSFKILSGHLMLKMRLRQTGVVKGLDPQQGCFSCPPGIRFI